MAMNTIHTHETPLCQFLCLGEYPLKEIEHKVVTYVFVIYVFHNIFFKNAFETDVY